LGILLFCGVVAAGAAPRAALAQDKTFPESSASADKASGRVTLTMGQGGLLLSASGGKGNLTFQGEIYAFELGGIGIGEFGGAKAVCVGKVYHLTRLEDFSGAYVQFESGYTGTKGKGELWLKNTKGVEIRLRSKTKGFDLTAEAEGVVIKLKDAKK
jgi:hypothetical protein